MKGMKGDKGMGKTMKKVGLFFGILFILFGLLLLFGSSPIAGLVAMFIGALMCYGGSRSGKEKTYQGFSSLSKGNVPTDGNKSLFEGMKDYFYEHEEEFRRIDWDRRHR